jgi:hypothetical protein
MKDFKFHRYPLAVFKTSIIYFPPTTPQKAGQNHLPHICTMKTTSKPTPTSEKVYIAQTNPRLLKDSTPQKAGNLTMERKMIHNLPTSLTHTTPVNHNGTLFP